MNSVFILFSTFMSVIISQLIKQLFRPANQGLSLFSGGGFPSSHTALFTSLAFAIWLSQGFTALFVVVLILALSVIRELFGLRETSRNYAVLINKHLNENLREDIGHNLVEIVGGFVVGLSITLLFYYLI